MTGFILGVWLTLVCLVLLAEFCNYMEERNG